MIRLKHTLAILALTAMVLQQPAFCQSIKIFTPDSAQFLIELSEFFENVSNNHKQEVKKLLTRLEFEWEYGQFNDAYRAGVYSTANLMLQEKLKPYPDFYGFLKVILHFYDTKQSRADYDSLHASFVSLLQMTNKKPFQDYLKSINGLFEKQYLYDFRGVIWKYSGGDFIFMYDSIPRFSFQEVTLRCVVSRDSIELSDTRGIYYPLKDLWVGQGGTVTWERAGYRPEEVRATLGDYAIQLPYAGYSADTVAFYHTSYFRQPLIGTLEDKVTSFASPDKAYYPVFESHIKRIQIQDLFKDIHYDGGFRMEGAEVLGSGSDERNATVSIFYQDRELMVLGAQRFSIQRDRIGSQRATATIYFESDSVFHPGLQFKYIDSERELSLIRGKEGLSESPYYDSYHEVDMFFETLYWKVGEPVISLEKMKGLSPTGQATFESNNFYTEYRFDRIMGIDARHPLILIKNFVRNNPDRSFYVTDLAAFMQKSVDQIRAMVIQLTNQGFLNYDVFSDRATVKDKLYKFIDAKSGKTDYDAIRINSEVENESNATLNLKTFDLKIKGVPIVSLSDSQQVYLYPYNNEILLRQNRNFVFTGRVHAGLLDFYARESTFDYDSFKLNMPVIDSLSFMVRSQEPDKEGKFKLVRVKSVIRNLNGTLWIDHPENKSGLKDYPYYPYFTSEDDSYVYYSDPEIEDGIYNDSVFYYRVYPFTFDSLNQFTTEGLQFAGRLVSGGIFPDIEQPLSVQSDYSLGFVNKSPLDGYPVYGDAGQFRNDISLSNLGLKGSGTLEYLTSKATSDEFTFFPDSVRGQLNALEISEVRTGTEYPHVVADTGSYRWLTRLDSLEITSVHGTPFAMFKEQATMEGTLKLTPDFLYGDGVVAVKDGEVESRNLVFGHHVFSSDTANFRLLTMDKARLALSTYVYSAYVDMDQRIGEFSSTGGASLVDLPVNQFICFMDRFEWQMDEQRITLYNTLSVDTARISKLSYAELIDADLKGSEFISTNPAQDSLEFFSLKADYDLRDNILYAEDVKLIKVADAAVFPGDGKVVIRKEAQMEPLVDALIIADTARKSHAIYDATVTIHSRKSYRASGTYDYTDELGEVYPIYFNDITTDQDDRTFAVAQIPDSVDFRLSPYFDFRGKALLVTSREFLTFEGGYRIRQDCDPIPASWVKFTSEVNPQNVLLPVDDTLRDLTNKRISNALVMSAGYDVYPAFFGRKDRLDETEIITAKGYISYDKPSQEFRIAHPDRLQEDSKHGNYMILSNKSCVLYGEGRLNTGVDYGEVTLGTYGTARYFLVPDSAVFDMMVILDFFFSEDVLEILIDQLVLSNMPGIDITKDSYRNALISMIGKEMADELLTELSLYGSLRRLPSELKHTMVISEVQMIWNDRTNSYISRGAIGLSSILDRSINKYAQGTIELAKRRNGDELNIYIETAEKQWFYFNYSNHIMQSISSLDTYNGTLSSIKEDKRIMDLENSKATYQYIISTRQKMIEFISRMQSVERN